MCRELKRERVLCVVSFISRARSLRMDHRSVGHGRTQSVQSGAVAVVVVVVAVIVGHERNPIAVGRPTL